MDMKYLTDLTLRLRKLDPSLMTLQFTRGKTLYGISYKQLFREYIIYNMSDLESDNLKTCFRYNYNTISGAASEYDISDGAIGFTVDYHDCIFVANPITSIFTKGDNYYLDI